MLYNFLELERNAKKSLSEQLYEGLRAGIEMGRLKPGEKLLSIRQASAELSLSRTTVENAYQRLMLEGFAESRPQSGYRVRSVIPKRKVVVPEALSEPRYDFTTHGTDPDEADMENWKRLLRRVLSDKKAVSTYGDPQGEPELRRALSSYAFRARGVDADPSRIFIGAGTGPLLQLLCPLLSRVPIVMEEPGFPLLERIFSDYGFPLERVDADGDYPERKDTMIVSLPSLRARRSTEEVIEERNELLRWLSESDGRYMIEDDYNGELRYRTRPLPSFQGLAPERTVYIGSFSKLLLPSVRVAYMVLPETLAGKARERLSDLNQTAGKTEQLALAEYIDSGLLEKHLRRLRRLYSRRSQIMEASIKEVFGDRASYELLETSLSFILSLSISKSSSELVSLAEEKGIAVRPATNGSAVLLGFSAISEEGIRKGMKELGDAWA